MGKLLREMKKNKGVVAPDDLVTAKEMLANPLDEHNRTYLRGVWDGLQSANVSLEENHQKRLFCQPPKLGIPLDQVISILRRYIGDDHRLTTVAGRPARRFDIAERLAGYLPLSARNALAGTADAGLRLRALIFVSGLRE